MSLRIKNIVLHLDKWKDLYELACVVAALLLSYYSVQESRKATQTSMDSVALTAESLRIQEKEFRLRNRPYVVINSAGLGGPVKSSDGSQYEHSVVLIMENISDIPANDIRIECVQMLNSNRVGFTAIVSGALAREKSMSAPMYLEDTVYQQITNTANDYAINTTIVYSGMLSETQGEYSTSMDIIYLPSEAEFKFSKIRYK